MTLENTEKPKCASSAPCLHIISALEPSERPLDIQAHGADPKCRFFWKMGTPIPKEGYTTRFPGLNAANVVPGAYEGSWEKRLEKWGTAMKDA